MAKKYLIALAVFLILAAGAAGWRFWRGKQDPAAGLLFNTGFVLLDDEKSLVWRGDLSKLDAETRASFENKIKEIKADLAAAKNKDQVLADYNNLGIYYTYLTDYRAAYDAYLNSLTLESRARVAWQNLADVLLKAKAYKTAEAAYLKAVELNKYIPESYVKLADFYQAMANDAKTEATYKLAIETIKQSYESDTLVLSDYASWLEEKQRYADAIKILQDLLAKQPENKAVLESRIRQLKNKQ